MPVCSPTAGAGRVVARVRADLRAAPPHRLDHGHQVVRGWRGPDHRLDLDVVDRSSTRRNRCITFLCSPNNPTGRAEPPEVVAHVLERAPGLVVVDEAYGQFAPWSALDLLARGVAGAERLVVVRTFSKTWSMAACRLGYLVADPDVVGRVRSRGPAVPPRRHDPGRRAPGLAPRRRHGGARGAHHRGARPHRLGARGAGRSSRGPRTPTSSSSAPPAAPPPRCGRTSWGRRCWCATARAGRGSTTACGSRWGRPRRTTGSWLRSLALDACRPGATGPTGVQRNLGDSMTTHDDDRAGSNRDRPRP